MGLLSKGSLKIRLGCYLSQVVEEKVCRQGLRKVVGGSVWKTAEVHPGGADVNSYTDLVLQLASAEEQLEQCEVEHQRMCTNMGLWEAFHHCWEPLMDESLGNKLGLLEVVKFL